MRSTHPKGDMSPEMWLVGLWFSLNGRQFETRSFLSNNPSSCALSVTAVAKAMVVVSVVLAARSVMVILSIFHPHPGLVARPSRA